VIKNVKESNEKGNRQSNCNDISFLVELDGQSALSGCHAPNAIVTGSEVPRHDTTVVM